MSGAGSTVSLSSAPPPGPAGGPELLEARACELLKLSTLYQVSQMLAGEVPLSEALPGVLGLIERDHEVLRSAITLVDEERGDLFIEASAGLGIEGRRARYRLGEGITGQVVATGQPAVVPDVAREPRFLHRTVRRSSAPGEAVTFVCVPVFRERRPVGALGVDLPFHPDRDYDRTLQFLHVVASLLAQALAARDLAERERRALLAENATLRQELRARYDFSGIIGTGGGLQQVFAQVAQVSETSATVLIRGESGTGKELVAQAIHHHSARSAGPFIKVNCGALPESLLESELFGHERGAFTGASARKKGRFELAHGGTLFLDEVGELSPAAQVRLLRVLQEREFERVGGSETLRVDVRLIAATNRDLDAAIAAGKFRDDLYYRLNVFPIFVPPLRERKADLGALTDHFIDKHARGHGRRVKRITTPAIDMLMAYHWPGNVRELENVIERAVLVSGSDVIHARHLPPSLQTAEATGTAPDSLGGAVAALERDLIQDALKSARGSRAGAARQLKTTERILAYKVRKYRIDPDRFR
jgi:Nif-specific regulatory protein